MTKVRRVSTGVVCTLLGFPALVIGAGKLIEMSRFFRVSMAVCGIVFAVYGLYLLTTHHELYPDDTP